MSKIKKFKKETFFTGHVVILIYNGNDVVDAFYSNSGMSEIGSYRRPDIKWDMFSVLYFNSKARAISILDLTLNKINGDK